MTYLLMMPWVLWEKKPCPATTTTSTTAIFILFLGGSATGSISPEAHFSFTVELFTRYYLFHEKLTEGQRGSTDDLFRFDRYLLFGDAFVSWQDYDHPQFGRIQIGGFKKNYVRINPGFMLEEEAHRVTAFSLYHAWHTLQLEITAIETREIEAGLSEITAIINNTRLIPTHSGVNLQFRIDRPNLIKLEGPKVLAGMIVKNRDLKVVEEQRQNPHVLNVGNIPGMAAITVRWIVEGNATGTIAIDSPKGGIVVKDF